MNGGHDRASLEVRQALAHDFPALQQMLELYQYELSDIWLQETDAQARYGYDLEPHRRGERSRAYVALEGSQYAGLALVSPARVTLAEGWWMEQFFVLKAFRRQGTGFALARHVIHRHPGAWEVGQMPANTAAQAFWRRTIAAITAGSFVEVRVQEGWWQGVVQQFHVPPRLQPPAPPATPTHRATQVASRTLATALCTLEPLLEAHAAEMFEVLADPAIYEFENAPPPSAQWLAERYRRLGARAPDDGSEQWLNWAVRLPGGALAGYVQASVLASGVASVAYELGSRHWRQGIGSSAVRAMLDELHAHHGVHTFVAVLKARNHRSLALLRSLGFEPASPELQALHREAPDEAVMARGVGVAS